MSHARWMTTSAPRNRPTRSSCSMSAWAHSVRGADHCGSRRATPRIDATLGSSASAATTLVPTLPVAPSTTTRTACCFSLEAMVNPFARCTVGTPAARSRDRASVVRTCRIATRPATTKNREPVVSRGSELGLNRCFVLVNRECGGDFVAGQAECNGDVADPETERGHDTEIDPFGNEPRPAVLTEAGDYRHAGEPRDDPDQRSRVQRRPLHRMAHRVGDGEQQVTGDDG